jgi:ADP-heptose:LPS heptosyltransferase
VVIVGNGLRQFFSLGDAAHSVISVDSRPAHAAAALSVPLVFLYGVHPLVATTRRIVNRDQRC